MYLIGKTTTKTSKGCCPAATINDTLDSLVESRKQLHAILYETVHACERVIIYSVCNSFLYKPSYFVGFFFFFLFPVTEKAHPEDAQTKNYPNRKCRLLELALLKAH